MKLFGKASYPWEIKDGKPVLKKNRLALPKREAAAQLRRRVRNAPRKP